MCQYKMSVYLNDLRNVYIFQALDRFLLRSFCFLFFRYLHSKILIAVLLDLLTRLKNNERVGLANTKMYLVLENREDIFVL